MNTSQLHIGVNLGLQKIASNINDEFLPQEIDYFLNEAVKDYIKMQFSSMKSQDRNIESQFVNENIRTLLSTVNIANIELVTYLPNSIKGNLPADYLYFIFSRIFSNSKWKNCRKLEPKAIKDFVETEFNSPLFREYPLMIENDKVIIIGSSLDVLSVNDQVSFTYVKKPNVISYSTLPNAELTLPDHTHNEVVDIAVNKILNIIVPRQQ